MIWPELQEGTVQMLVKEHQWFSSTTACVIKGVQSLASLPKLSAEEYNEGDQEVRKIYIYICKAYIE